MSTSNAMEKAKSAAGVYFRESEARRFQGKPDKCFYFTFRDSRNKFAWEKVGWASEGYNVAKAANLRAEKIRAIRHGEDVSKKKKARMTFGEVWKHYAEWQESNVSRPIESQYLYDKHLKSRFEKKFLDEISALDLEKFKAELLNEGKAPATAKHILALVRQVFNKARDWGFFDRENPVGLIKLPRLNNRRERFLSRDEAKILLAALEKKEKRCPQLRTMALLSLFTGMRAGEIFSLKWGHLDFENEVIQIADPKSGRARKVFMTPSVKATLQSKSKGEQGELVFNSRDGKKISGVSNAFARVVKELGWNDGIEDRRQQVTFHTLRHTFASWLAIQGTHVLQIKELMGHQSLAMTERYSHLIPDVKRDAVRRLEE